jgi:collagenase-like PrtC family protease
MAMTARRLELCIGPLLFNWPADQVERFYAMVAETPDVDRVYLGEIVCGKRAPLLAEALGRAAARLQAAGKTVVPASLALPSTPRERRAARDLASSGAMIEINDLSLLADHAGGPFVAGPLLNVYNEDAARELQDRGCVRLCANVELSLEALGKIAEGCPGLEIEIFAFGRLPLALSARCHHAHAHGRTKDSCQFVCGEDPDGRAVRTVEGAPFLAVNGVQTLSHGVQIADLPPQALLGAGVRALRLSPHTGDMASLIAAFRRFADGDLDAAGLQADARRAGPGELVSGYLRARPGLAAAGTP